MWCLWWERLVAEVKAEEPDLVEALSSRDGPPDPAAAQQQQQQLGDTALRIGGGGGGNGAAAAAEWDSSEEEVEVGGHGGHGGVIDARKAVPWRAFLRNPPLRALAYTHFCNSELRCALPCSPSLALLHCCPCCCVGWGWVGAQLQLPRAGCSGGHRARRITSALSPHPTPPHPPPTHPNRLVPLHYAGLAAHLFLRLPLPQPGGRSPGARRCSAGRGRATRRRRASACLLACIATACSAPTPAPCTPLNPSRSRCCRRWLRSPHQRWRVPLLTR